MHELSVCYALLDQVGSLARQHGASTVTRIVLRIGPLSGVEPELLRRAWSLAAAGTAADEADLIIEASPVTVECSRCHLQSDALPNRMICAHCGDFRTNVISGDEMILQQVELSDREPRQAQGSNVDCAAGGKELRP